MLRLFKPKESDKNIDQIIKRGKDLERMLKTPGWKDIESWISEQHSGHTEYLESKTRQVGLWSVLKLFNTFIQYLAFLNERRAYRKLLGHITINIENGRKKSELAAKREQQRERAEAKAAKK